MKTYEFWRHGRTNEVWAVELTDGDVSGCRGPLRPSEISPSHVADYDYSPAEAGRLQAERDRFDLVSERELIVLSAASD